LDAKQAFFIPFNAFLGSKTAFLLSDNYTSVTRDRYLYLLFLVLAGCFHASVEFAVVTIDAHVRACCKHRESESGL
jgi:hypothetical protein